jgi:maleylacetate reductase
MTHSASEAVSPFAYDALPGRVVFGVGLARSALLAEVDRLGAERLLVITDSREAPRADGLVNPFRSRVVGSFSRSRPHVPDEVADAAVAMARATGADGLMAIGGGSTTGTAKAVALVTGLPILAVPTTYAGSEMTPIWGKTTARRKMTGRADVVLPKVVLYDPELTLSLPASAALASGMNAMAHAVEALYAPGRNPVTSVIAEEAIRTLAASISLVAAEPSGLNGRSLALYGACLAGCAFAVAGSGLHHKICHVLGGAFDLPHADTHSVILPHVVAFQQRTVPELMDRVAADLGVGPGEAATALKRLAEVAGIPLALRDIGAPRDGLDALAQPILESLPADSPGPPSAEDIRAILAAAYTGGSPEVAVS